LNNHPLKISIIATAAQQSTNQTVIAGVARQASNLKPITSTALQYLLATIFLFLITSSINAKSYMTQEEFLQLTVKQLSIETDFKTKTLWLNKELQKQIKDILNHNYPKLRLRYKISLNERIPTTVWYLDEIGKERPISFGVSIKEETIQLIRVLEFRESRGYEIEALPFAEQFNNARLNEDRKLNKNIDGITGATMSVSAMKKISRVALFLHQFVLKE